MFRRSFIQRLTSAATGALAGVRAAEGSTTKRVVYKIKGFTCVTCAVGLETLLRRVEGVSRVEASYAKAEALIEFNPAIVTEARLKEYVGEMGFGVGIVSAG